MRKSRRSFMLRRPAPICPSRANDDPRAQAVNCALPTGEVSVGRSDYAKREREYSAVLGGICPHGLRRRGRA